MSKKRKLEKFCVLMCAYNEEAGIAAIVKEACKYCDSVVLVDDGSTDNTAINAREAGAEVLTITGNSGKSAALNYGLAHIREKGVDAVVTLDADNRHNPASIPDFVDTYERTGIPVLCGNRMWKPTQLTFLRRILNQVMSNWLLGLTNAYVPDPPCGFRLYRADIIPYVMAEDTRYCAEFEMMFNIARRRVRIDSVRINHEHTKKGRRLLPLKDFYRFFAVVFNSYKQRDGGLFGISFK